MIITRDKKRIKVEGKFFIAVPIKFHTSRILILLISSIHKVKNVYQLTGNIFSGIFHAAITSIGEMPAANHVEKVLILNASPTIAS